MSGSYHYAIKPRKHTVKTQLFRVSGKVLTMPQLLELFPYTEDEIREAIRRIRNTRGNAAITNENVAARLNQVRQRTLENSTHHG